MIDGTRPPDDGFLPTGQHDTQPPSEKDSLAEVPRGQNFGVRFVDLGLIDRGAMGEVHRCWDRVLGREVAVKVLPADEKQHAALAEARLAARLQHPGILTVYEIGMLPNGDQWLAMREVSGHTFGGALVAAGDAPEALRPLISLLHKVCDAMAYAHARGVVHRDLKPANIRVGEFGEVIVLDWGIAGEVGQPLDPIGTKGFMPPEQAEVTPLDPRMDIYALGQLLRLVLKGRETEEAAPLVALAEQATRLDAAERPGDARALATALGRWLDGADAREAARALIEEAKALRGEIAALRAKAAELREAAGAILDDVPSHAPIEEKAPAWAMEDEAAAAERKADACEATYEGRLDEARRRSDEVTEARTLLGRLYRARIEAADATNDIRRAEANEARLRAVDHEGAYAEFLTGDGELTLVTDPPGAEVWAARYVTETRRLVPGDEVLLGRTPLRGVALGRGSWQLRLVKNGFSDVIYPVLMTRCGHWDGVPPGADEPQPIALPPLGEIGEGERYVPAGWFGSGGDPLATDGLPARRFWVDGFVIGRDPLTYTDLLADLETMSQRGQLAHARRVAPLAKGKRTTIVEVRETDEGFRAVPRPDSPWSPDWPVVDLNWFQARAWADWRRDSRGRPWRLPHSLEWEKAARGVDRRLLPWGDAFDPTWANVTDSFPDRAHPCGVADFPADLSPYGVRGLAGNTRDWCYDVYRRHGLPRGVEHVLIETVPSEGKNHNCRGGAWSSKGSFCRPATRMAGPPTASGAQIGVRLARPFPAPADQMTSSIIL